jgi:GNAT superfamily N-acetyltransferase
MIDHPAPDHRAYTSTLPDGTRVLFRAIRADDKERLAEGFEALSTEARYTRFFRPMTRLRESQLAYLTEVDGRDHVAWVAVGVDEPSRGIGVGRWIRLVDEPEVAEVAITVIDEFQHLGIGRTLLWLAARSAVELDVRAFRTWMLGGNRAALGLLKGLGGSVGEWEQGVYAATTPLPETVEQLDGMPPPLVLKPLRPTPADP